MLLYHNLYDFSEYPVPDGEFLGMAVLPYKVHCEKYNGSDLTNEDDKIFILSDVSFINLNPDIAFDERKNYCPYNFFNSKFKNNMSFGIKFIINEKEYIYPFSIIADDLIIGIEKNIKGFIYIKEKEEDFEGIIIEENSNWMKISGIIKHEDGSEENIKFEGNVITTYNIVEFNKIKDDGTEEKVVVSCSSIDITDKKVKIEL